MLSFGIYKKQLVLFLILIPVLILGWYLVSKHYSSASVVDVEGGTNESNNYVLDIEIQKDAQVFINGIKTQRTLFVGDDVDTFRYIAAEEEGVYIESLEIVLHLPEGATKDEINAFYYAVHGVGQGSVYKQDNQTIIYKASDISPTATFTIVAKLPTGLINFSFWQIFVYTAANMDPYLWLLVSLIPFMATLFYLFYLYRKSIIDWQLPEVKSVSNLPPSDLSPAEASILIERKISSRAISATLLDLAKRGYINIVHKNDDFFFVKRKNLESAGLQGKNDLNKFEKILLSKIFTSENNISKKEDILFRVSHHVFSRKIAQAYINIYESVAQKGYFVTNPAQKHQNYRYFGVALFFVAFIGLVIGSMLSIEPKYYLLVWLVMMFVAIFIIKISNYITFKTKLGHEMLIKWLAFRNYLSSKEDIGQVNNPQLLFEKYLAHAVALGCEIEWAKRFSKQRFEVPNWYISRSPIYSLGDFVNEVFPIIGFVSKILVASREPIV